MASTTLPRATTPPPTWREKLNSRYHRLALNLFMLVVLAHWAEHLVQAFQVWVLDWPRPRARGLLGMPFPWLIETEWLHYGYAVVMLVGLWLLRPGFAGRAYRLWTIALWIQFFHHIEHFLLLVQALTGTNFFGASAPTSLVQTFFPRVELHLFYNTVVFVPMVLAMIVHLRPSAEERAEMHCGCAGAHAPAAA